MVRSSRPKLIDERFSRSISTNVTVRNEFHHSKDRWKRTGRLWRCSADKDHRRHTGEFDRHLNEKKVRMKKRIFSEHISRRGSPRLNILSDSRH